MSRDQRAADNWALLFAQELAWERQAPLAVVFCLAPSFLGATLRHYAFMLAGLEETARALAAAGIPFVLLTGQPGEAVPRFIREHRAGALVTDFDPLRIKRDWKEAVARSLDLPFWEVDAHNVVPCWAASPKQEYGAYTLRPKLHRLLAGYLTEIPALRSHPWPWVQPLPEPDGQAALLGLGVDRDVVPVNWLKPGETAAGERLRQFLATGLASYDRDRNDPNREGQSDLSPYLHYGQIAPQRVALEVRQSSAPEIAKEAFLEELIVRRELSDNFCFYNPHYDQVRGFPDWARKTLDERRRDRREYLYTREELEQARTHDDLWNAAQLEMVDRGKMHGYLRMYWAKKILEWSPRPEAAMAAAIYLNDRYSLDGRDPNGYAGIAWSIGGVHDRAWKERPVFGKIRYMSRKGCEAKFDAQAYMRKHLPAHA